MMKWIQKILDKVVEPKPITFPVLECRERWLDKLLEDRGEDGDNQGMDVLLQGQDEVVSISGTD
jgi:hypothetical protein